MALLLTILTPERKLPEGTEVEELTLTTSEGMIQILPGHAPMVGTLETGIFTYRTAAGEKVGGFISTGFFEVKDERVSLMAETIEFQDEINLERAKKAQRVAEETLRQAELDESKFKKYQLKLDRAVTRQEVAGRELDV
jgi:F-type H+-transporting ATPase subunit epsilon